VGRFWERGLDLVDLDKRYVIQGVKASGVSQVPDKQTSGVFQFLISNLLSDLTPPPGCGQCQKYVTQGPWKFPCDYD
jgi:hypothetical protein